ncbi:grpE protein homolog 2, mitochondrial-like isoform X1 [Magnolia sinica]|uniref:grpE protein homolog 2, mitochondrial-like isoform X1 n=1 Tax=Magnolia sinica TaxID=86752 RepID=UPI00265A00F3|nr:grpE protein homolog 2, mitochondrial-like isoform X1 [Magnolia sinica]
MCTISKCLCIKRHKLPEYQIPSFVHFSFSSCRSLSPSLSETEKMVVSRVLCRLSKNSLSNFWSFASSTSRQELLPNFSKTSFNEWVPCRTTQLTHHSFMRKGILQRFGFSSSASPQSNEKETNQVKDKQGTVVDKDNISQDDTHLESTKKTEDSAAPDQAEFPGSSSDPQSVKKRRRTKRTAFSDSDTDDDLSMDDLVKLVAEKEELLKLKHKEVELLQEKVLRSYAEMENVIERTRREAENSKKFAIQAFAKSLLDVADNLGRASSIVRESFSKIDQSKDSAGAVPLLKTLLEGVEMTEKQLIEVFRKFGVEKFNPINEQFDPNRHYAVFQVPDASKPPGTVAAVLKSGYMLYDRVLRPAEVGVTVALNDGVPDQSSKA